MMQKTIDEGANQLLVPADEARLLAGLRGEKLLFAEGHFAELQLVFEDRVFCCLPELGEAVFHNGYEEIVRLAFANRELYDRSNPTLIARHDFGHTVVDVSLLSTLLTFHDSYKVIEEPLLKYDLDVDSLARSVWDWVKPFTPQSQKAFELAQSKGDVSQVDVGIRLSLADGTSFVVLTDGSSYHLFIYRDRHEMALLEDKALALAPERRLIEQA